MGVRARRQRPTVGFQLEAVGISKALQNQPVLWQPRVNFLEASGLSGPSHRRPT